MTERQALALAVMACEFVAADAPDIADWRQAAALLRAALAELRGPCPAWDWYSKPAGRTKAKGNGVAMAESEAG